MRRVSIVIVACIATAALADDVSPYAGEQDRSIKSLSDAEILSLRNGEGMGFARLAELNHYPGPRHVLELAEQLELSDEQLRQTEALFSDMHRSAVSTGAEIIEAERRLDARFAARDVDPDSLSDALTQLGALRARLRYIHLEAHLLQRDLLTEEQIQTYDRLRGYGADGHDSGRHDGHH